MIAGALRALDVTLVSVFNFVAVAVELSVAQALLVSMSWEKRTDPRRLAMAALALAAFSALLRLLRSMIPGAYLGEILSFGILFFASCASLRWSMRYGWDQSAAVGICAYAIQHVAQVVVSMADLLRAQLPVPWAFSWLVGEAARIAIFALVYAVFYYVYVRHFTVSRIRAYSQVALAALVSCGLLIVVGLSAYTHHAALSSSDEVAIRIACLLACLMILLVFGELSQNSKLTDELAFQRRMGEMRTRHYESLRDEIEITNIHYHDLKHQILRLRGNPGSVEYQGVLDELAESIDGYAHVSKTGCAALDVVLTQKDEECRRAGIRLTHMVEKGLLDGICDHDIYSLFGNALDNALEATATLADASRRIIKLSVVGRGPLVIARVSNFYARVVPDGKGGLSTTKADSMSHGYGMKSMRSIVEGLGGTLDFTAEDGLFELSLVFPRQ